MVISDPFPFALHASQTHFPATQHEHWESIKPLLRPQIRDCSVLFVNISPIVNGVKVKCHELELLELQPVFKAMQKILLRFEAMLRQVTKEFRISNVVARTSLISVFSRHLSSKTPHTTGIKFKSKPWLIHSTRCAAPVPCRRQRSRAHCSTWHAEACASR